MQQWECSARFGLHSAVKQGVSTHTAEGCEAFGAEKGEPCPCGKHSDVVLQRARLRAEKGKVLLGPGSRHRAWAMVPH